MAAVARDLDNILFGGVTAVIAAILRLACDHASTCVVFTLVVISHKKTP